MRRQVLLMLAVFFAASLARAAEPSAKVIEYGLYSETVTGLTPAEGTSGSVIVHSTNIVHVETTRTIPARVGESFGFRLQYSDLPTDRPFVIRKVTLHPPIKQPSGETLTQSVQENTYPAARSPQGTTQLCRWSFLKGFEYELVPGDWTWVVSVDGKEVLRYTLQVVNP